MKSTYEAIYSKDFGADGKSTTVKDPHGWIQWKGTNVCIDLHCKCGKHSHYDGDFLYHWICPHCGVAFALGQNVKLIELTSEQIEDRTFQTSAKED